MWVVLNHLANGLRYIIISLVLACLKRPIIYLKLTKSSLKLNSYTEEAC